MSRLTIEPSDGNVERGRNLLGNCQMVAIFPARHAILLAEEGTTLACPNIFFLGSCYRGYY